MHLRMPRSILWASQGGIAPTVVPNKQIVTCAFSVSVSEGLSAGGSQELRAKVQMEPDDQNHHPQGQALQGGGPDLQQLQGGEGTQQEIKAVLTAGSNRMPGPIVQASRGGTSPRTNSIKSNPKHHQIQGKVEEETEADHQANHQEDSMAHQEGAVWVKGSREEDKRRYRELMAYMEEKRVETKELLKRGEEKKEKARRKEDHWKLFRLSTAYLRENERGWMLRRIKEHERIKEEEKEDRLALVREKKRKYGLKRISKEENLRLKKRTEERLEIASARANLWKRHRDGKEGMGEEATTAWEDLRKSLIELEEEEDFGLQEERKSLATISFEIKKSELRVEEREDQSDQSVLEGGRGRDQGGQVLHGDEAPGGGGKGEPDLEREENPAVPNTDQPILEGGRGQDQGGQALQGGGAPGGGGKGDQDSEREGKLAVPDSVNAWEGRGKKGQDGQLEEGLHVRDGGRVERDKVPDNVRAGGVDQSDQSVMRGEGQQGELCRIKLQGSDIFNKNRNQSQTISVKERVQGIERMVTRPTPDIKDGLKGSRFGFSKSPIGDNPFVLFDSPIKRRKLDCLSMIVAPITSARGTSPSTRRSRSRRRPLNHHASQSQLSTPSRRTSKLSSMEGTRGRALAPPLSSIQPNHYSSSVLLQQSISSKREASSTQPPENWPQPLLLFGTSCSGTSTATSSCSSSSSGKRKLERKPSSSSSQSQSMRDTMNVRKFILNIECNESTEVKKKESILEERKSRSKESLVEGRKKKCQEDILSQVHQGQVGVHEAYLQGVRPEARRGLFHALPDHPESWDDNRE